MLSTNQANMLIKIQQQKYKSVDSLDKRTFISLFNRGLVYVLKNLVYLSDEGKQEMQVYSDVHALIIDLRALEGANMQALTHNFSYGMIKYLEKKGWIVIEDSLIKLTDQGWKADVLSNRSGLAIDSGVLFSD